MVPPPPITVTLMVQLLLRLMAKPNLQPQLAGKLAVGLPRSDTRQVAATLLSHVQLSDEFSQPHPEYSWIAVGAVIGVAAAIHVCSLLWSIYRRRAFKKRKTSGIPTATAPRASTIRALPNAVLSAARIAAFRLPTGLQMAMIDVLATVAYLLIISLWLGLTSA